MSLKDIEKLKEKVDKDPNSKLFVPLAEEFRKEGMLDEAIDALLTGLERQPAYMSARVALGKIYVEKGMLPEAKAEFENVIKSIPDNLFAHKKLAEIYRDTGERESAIKAYRVVLRLNALDDDAQMNITTLEAAASAPAPPPVQAEAAPDVPEPPEAAVPEELHPSIPEEVHSRPQTMSQDDLAAFKSSLFGEEPAGEEEALTLAEEEEMGIMEEADEGAISFGDISEVLVDKPAVAEPAPAVNIPVVEDMAASFADIETEPAPVQAKVAEPPTPPAAEAVPEASVAPVEDFFAAAAEPEPIAPQAAAEPVPFLPPVVSEPEPFVPPVVAEAEPFVPPVIEAESPSRPEEPAPAGPVEPAFGLADADRMVDSGDFGGAILIYKKMLERNPGDRKILQRVEELKTLLKLMGKDKEYLVGKLNSFLEGITRRRDEFFGNP